MSTNSSSSSDKDFEKPADDSADVPVLAVTAELPVGNNAQQVVADAISRGELSGDTAPLSALPQEVIVDGPASGGGDTSPTPTPPDFLAPLQRAGAPVDPSAVTPIPTLEPEEPAQLPAEALTGPGSDILSAVSLEGHGGSDKESTPAVFTSAIDLPRVQTSTNEAAPVPPGDVVAAAESALPEEELDGESTSLDASDLVIEGEAEAQAAAAALSREASDVVFDDGAGPRRTVQGMPVYTAAPGSPDDEFLRRVVLPPLPKVPSRPTTLPGMPVVPVDTSAFDDHTVISDPPSPELLASMAPPPRAPGGHAMAVPGTRAERSKPVRLSYMQLFTLLLLAGVGGGFASNYLRGRLPVASTASRAETTAVSAPVAPERVVPTPPPAAVAPAVPPPAPLPTAPVVPAAPVAAVPAAPAKTSAGGPSGPRAEARPTPRAGKAAKRARRVKRAPAKKAWVDPFE